ncbi:MAG: 2Fe-2S iron-sulfur cluster binding domain-containing protein [Bacteroidetes bacterium]|nr:2Fe-2S iron-sulfur cluster binding domain-containing protein [Bacteroidota bacterium]
MSKFYPLKVLEITRETPDCVSLVLEIPPSLSGIFAYKQGQYITIRNVIDGEEVRRSYSISSCPYYEREFRIAVKKVSAGKLSPFINDKLSSGESIEVMPPSGIFYSELKPENRKVYIFFAGGSGITPVISNLKSILHAEPSSSVILFYANRDNLSVIFRTVLDVLNKKYASRFNLYYVFDTDENTLPEFTGLMTKDKAGILLDRYVPANSENEYFICGPLPLMNNVKAVLEEICIPKEKIHIEYFTTAIEDNRKAESAFPEAGAVREIVSNVTVSVDGVKTVFNLISSGKTILDAALAAGADVPFSCKGGICRTCFAKLVQGEVKMEKNFALTDGEIEGGYILTCQSHPVTPKVEIDYSN